MSKFKEVLETSFEKPLTEQVEEKLDAESLKDFYEALADSKVSLPILVNVLAEFGVHTSASVLSRWRNGTRIPSKTRKKRQ